MAMETRKEEEARRDDTSCCQTGALLTEQPVTASHRGWWVCDDFWFLSCFLRMLAMSNDVK